MKWGEIYRTRDKVAERGHKPSFYVIVSRDFIAGSDDISTVVCAPVYGEVLGLRTEVAIDAADGVPRPSSIRCDFLTLIFKKRLTGFVATLSDEKRAALTDALAHALQIAR